MRMLHTLTLHSFGLEVVVTFVIALLFVFVLPHNGLTFFFFLFWFFFHLFWMTIIFKKQIAHHQICKATFFLIANLLSFGILMLLPIIVFNYLPKSEDPVMDENESKQFDIYVASYTCTDNVILDSIDLNLELWTQYANKYVTFQSKEDIAVSPRFICYSCVIKNDRLYQNMTQMEYGIDWCGYYRKDAKGQNIVFAEYGVVASDVKDTIVMHITNLRDHCQIVDSLTFVRTTDPLVPDWGICQNTIRRHIDRSFKQRFLDRIYFDYFWNFLRGWQ